LSAGSAVGEKTPVPAKKKESTKIDPHKPPPVDSTLSDLWCPPPSNKPISDDWAGVMSRGTFLLLLPNPSNFSFLLETAPSLSYGPSSISFSQLVESGRSLQVVSRLLSFIY